MLRLIKYAINESERYGKPIVLIFCVNNISPRALATQFKGKENEYLKQLSCGIWAQKCLLIAERREDLVDPLHPLQAISSFFCQQKPTLFDHTYSDDATIKFLYKISKEATEEEVEYEDNYRHALEVVLQSNQKCLAKIKETISDEADMKKVRRLVDKGLKYNSQVQEQLRQTEDSDSELELPDFIPDKRNNQDMPSELLKEIAFLKTFKVKIGRMKWRQCLEEAHKAKLLTRYSTGESLRPNFFAYFKIVPR